MLLTMPVPKSYAVCPPNCGTCGAMVQQCSDGCVCFSDEKSEETRDLFTERIDEHYFDVIVGDIWLERILIDLYKMTAQLSSTAMDQVLIIGTFFDAKHQLETQRLFQTLTAEAHADYHPSEGLCEIGTNVRSLSSSARAGDVISYTIAKRSVERQGLSRNTATWEGATSDELSRLGQFVNVYCNPNDNMQNLNDLPNWIGVCRNRNKQNYNRDINYSETVGRHLTIGIDNSLGASNPDEQSVFALSSYLFANDAMPPVSAPLLVTREIPNQNAAQVYLDARALVAKRSVAVNSFANIAALKANGQPEATPFLYSIMEEIGVTADPGIITQYLGANPSYHAQMEMLTKKMHQNPDYYTELYDKPANVLRKDVATQATELMQKRDIFRSLLRSEAVLSVILETSLITEQRKIDNEVKKLIEYGRSGTL